MSARGVGTKELSFHFYIFPNIPSFFAPSHTSTPAGAELTLSRQAELMGEVCRWAAGFLPHAEAARRQALRFVTE